MPHVTCTACLRDGHDAAKRARASTGGMCSPHYRMARPRLHVIASLPLLSTVRDKEWSLS